MVLAELGDRIARAIREVSNAVIVDENVLDECLNEIERALLQADVQLKLVQDMVANVKKEINLSNMAPGLNKRKITEQAICHELCRMLDAGKPSFTPKKMNTSVIMFVGLQGSGKTTTCTKYANYYQKKGWRPALVCADTYRAGAFDQLKQNATKANIPYYGSYYESDPVKTAMEGVEKFRKENRDLIIIDTSGRHKQEEALFEEMRQLSEATKPDLVVFVMDSSIGQAAFGQAEAFKKSVPVGAVIVTKMDGHAKGGGALSAYYESDPVKTAMEGVEKFRKENRDLIIIDTSGRHKQEEALFEEMRQLSEATKPDLVVFVMDSSIGQAAFGQAEAFKKSVPVGAVIVTKMDGHAKGGGALSAVAATKSPVLFIGTGEHMDQLEAFDARAFVQRLLGKGDLSKFAEEAREVVSLDQQKDLVEQFTEGAFTLRKYQSFLKMGYQCAPMLSSHVPQSRLRGHDELNPTKIKKQIVMMDSMTREELDSSNVKLMNQSRIMRIARGAGCAVKEVMDLMEEFKRCGKDLMEEFKRNGKIFGKKNLLNILQMMRRQNLGIGGSSMMQNMMKQLSSGLGR